MSTFKIAIFGFFLLITLASGSKCPQEDAAKLVVCYYKSETSLSNFNICSCTHVVFTSGVRKGENNSLSLNEGVQRNLDLIKKKKDEILALFTLQVKPDDASAILKSENRSNELITGVADLLQESKFNGVELNFKFIAEDGVSKESYASFVKKLSKTLSSAHKRVKREGYDVFEKVQDDVTTAAYTTQTPKNSTTRTQSINRRNKTNKSRKTREDKDIDTVGEKVRLEEAINKEFASEKPTEAQTNKFGEEESEENRFLVFLRLSIDPEIIAKKFDLKILGRYADVLLVPTHDITNKNEGHVTYHPSRLMGISDMLNTDSVLDFLTGMGAPKSKIVITMPITVLKFQLKDVSKNTPRSPSLNKPQIIDQSQLCSLLSKKKNWTIEREDDLTAPYAYSGKTWLSFEDETSMDIKGKYILLRELAGGAVYPIDADTNDGSCTNRTRSGFLVEILHKNFQNLGRKPRALVLEDLQEEIHRTGFTGIEAGVKQSEYRIVRVVDHSGAVHVIRRNTKTQFECSRQGYFSHPLGCNKFYRCVKFDQYSDEFTVFEYDCPAGLAFDERWEVCVWPGSLPNGAPCTGSSEIAPVPRSHFQCPNQEGYYADLENCRWFFACLDHARDGITPLTAYEFRCPFGLVFNEERLACDWPWLVGSCGNRGAATFLKSHTTFINGGNLAASSGQYASLEQEASFNGFGRGFGSNSGSQSAGFGYIGSGIDDNQNKASFGSFPDYEISGGRILHKGGVILGQHIAGIDASSGNSLSGLYGQNQGASNVVGSADGADKQSGFLYHRNSQSIYGQGSISAPTAAVNIPVQNEYAGHSTVAANNLLVEYGQKETYRGDASFQDSVSTPKPFAVNIPAVQINEEEAYTGHSTTAANNLLAAGFGQKGGAGDFGKISVTPKTETHIFSNAVSSGGSVTSPVAFKTTPTPATFAGVLDSKGYSYGGAGGVSSVTSTPVVHSFEYTSTHGIQEGNAQGVSFHQAVNVQPGVTISTTPGVHTFEYTSSQGAQSGTAHDISLQQGVNIQPGVSVSAKPGVHSFEYTSSHGVQGENARGVSFEQAVNVQPGVAVSTKPGVHTFEYASSQGAQSGTTQDILLQQGVNIQPGVSISTPVSFSTTSRPSGFSYSSEHKSGFSSSAGISQSSPVISTVVTPKSEVNTFEHISSGPVNVQELGQGGVQFSTPKSNFKSITNGVTVSQTAVPITGGYFSQSGSNVGVTGSVTPKLDVQNFGYKTSSGQGAVSIQEVAFEQPKVSVSNPVSFSTTPKPQKFETVEISLNQPAITEGHSFGHVSSGDLNLRDSVASIPRVQTFEYTSSQGRESAVSGHGVFGQKFNLQPQIPVSTVRPQSSVDVVVNQPVTPIVGGYSENVRIDGPSDSTSGLYAFEHRSSGQISGLGKESFVQYGRANQNLRPIGEVSISQPALPIGGGFSYQQSGHGETSNTPKPGVHSFEFTSTQGKQILQGAGYGRSFNIQSGVSVGSTPSFSTTLRPTVFKTNNQPAAEYSFDTHSSEYSSGINVNLPSGVISSTLKPVVNFEKTSNQVGLGKQGRGREFVAFVSTPEPPTLQPVGVSVGHTISGDASGRGIASTTPGPHTFEYTSGQVQQNGVGVQNIAFGQSVPVQPVSVTTPIAFSTTPKPSTFKSFGVSVSQPSGFSVTHNIPDSGVHTFESTKTFNTQDVKISHPIGGVTQTGFGVSISEPAFKESNYAQGKQGDVSVSFGQSVTPAVQVFKNTNAFYPQVTPVPFQQNIDAKVSNELNLNKDITYEVPVGTEEQGLFGNSFGVKTAIGGTTVVDKSSGQQFSYSSFNRGGYASSKKISSGPKQQEILTEISIEQQPVVSIDNINSFTYDQRASTPEPNILSQAGVHLNIPSETTVDYQQQTFSQNVKSFTPSVSLQQELVPVTETKSYLPPVTPKTDIFRPAAKIVPFESAGRGQQDSFEFLKTQINEFKPREELEITKSIELNPNQFYQSTTKPIVVQQQPVHLLSQKTYSFDVVQPFGKDNLQTTYQAPVSSTPLPVSYSTLKTTIDEEHVGLSGGDGVTAGLFKPNIQIKTGSAGVSQNGQVNIAQTYIPSQEDSFFQNQNSFDFKKLKSAQKVYIQPQSVFGAQNITRFSLNSNIEIPEPPQEYLAQYTTQSPESSTRSRYKSTTYLPPENDNIQQVINKYNGRFGEVSRGQAYEGSSSTQRPRSRARQYHGAITANQKATNKYEEYEINGQGRSDSKTTIDLTNLKIDKDKKTVIVVSQVSDANPILIGKLAGQCSCQSNMIELKTKGKKSSRRKSVQITNEFLPPLETSLQREASTPETVVITSSTTPQPLSSTILSSLSPDGVLTITPKSVYAGSLKKKQFRGRARYLPASEDLLSAVPASEIASTVDYAGAGNEIDGSGRAGGAAFDRYGPGGWRGFDETLQGSVDCKRPGLFRHPKYCNKFYSCNYDPWKERYVLHVFNCPIHLAYDSSISACNWPVRGPACADDNLLV